MTYNPYAAPIGDLAVGSGGTESIPPRGAPQRLPDAPWLREAWQLYKAQWAPLSFGYLVVTVIGSVPGQVAPSLAGLEIIEPKSLLYYGLHAPLSLVGWFVAEYFMCGFVRAALKTVRAGDASFGDFFAAGGQFFPYLAMSFVRALAVVLGLVLLVVPGVIVMLGFANAPYFVVDQRLGPIAALKESWANADGQKAGLFNLLVAEIALTLLGLAACCFGIIVAVPFLQVARALVYTKMAGTAAPPTPEAPPAGGYGVYGPPGGGAPMTGGPPGYGPT